jgi:ferredoxin
MVLQNETERIAGLTAIDTASENQTIATVDDAKSQDDPRIPATAEEFDASVVQDTINLLRRFHLGEPLARAATTAPDPSYLPVQLNSFRSLRRFRYEYPLLLLPAHSGELLARPLDEFLHSALPDADGSARILKDNLAWIETYVREQISGQDFATLARDLFIEAGHALQENLGLIDADRETLQADLDALIESVPMGTHVLPYGQNVALYLLQHTIRHRTQWHREQLKRRIEKSVRGLQLLVDIEKGKTASGSITGEASRYFNDSSMAEILDHRSQGSVAMSATRLQRVESTLDVLAGFEPDEDILHLVVRSGSFSLGDASSIDIVTSDDPCAKALEIHDACATGLAKLYASLRTAELEVIDGYDARFHDSWFESFDVDAFSDAEKEMIPTVVAVESAERVTADCMQSFSTALGSGKPVQILINVEPHTNPGQKFDMLGGLRLELASLGMGHRHAVINQISAARFEALLAGFSAALGGHQACLHLIHTGFNESQPLHPWIVASAGLESRAHPHIRFDPTSTALAADLAFTGNPAAGQDWSTNPITYINEHDEPVSTELAFTFADYCLLQPELLDNFRLIPDACTSDDLVAVEDYLNADVGSQERMIPFIWSVDKDGLMRKLAVSRRLMFACRDRLDFWRSLQSLAGVKNIHVEEAVRDARDEEQQLAELARAELIKEHEEELLKVRTESASDVMSRLTNVLMELDLNVDMPAAAVSPAPAVIATDSAAVADTAELPEPAIEEEAEQEEEEVSFDEPWIDSIFCTTCDDCLALNKQMFVYNDNRQAIITDPKVGTYLQLVEGAELCPARCIHPGKPLDPAEPDLEDLIRRAEPFN